MVAAKQLFAVDAAGIMLADADGRLRWASASDPVAQTLEDNQETFAAGPCLQAFASGQPAVIHDATLEPRWGEITLALVELQIRSALSVPVQLGGGPIGTLDVYAAAPGGWDATEVSALQTYAGLVATLLGTAAKAQRSGRLAEQLRVALEARSLVEQAKVALMKLERLDDQQAFIDLRRAARSSRPKPTRPERREGRWLALPHGRAEPAGAADGRVPKLDMGALDGEVAAFLEREPGADGIGHKLSQLLLGFLATEVVPLARPAGRARHRPNPAVRWHHRHLAAVRRHPGASRPSPVTSRPGLAAQAELLQALDGLAAGGDAELAVDRHRLGLDRVLGHDTAAGRSRGR